MSELKTFSRHFASDLLSLHAQFLTGAKVVQTGILDCYQLSPWRHTINYSGDDARPTCDGALECSRRKKMQCCTSFSTGDVAPLF